MSDRSYRTVKQYAEQIQHGPDHVLALIHTGQLLAINTSIGKRASWRIPLDAILAFEAAQSTRPPDKPKRRRQREPAGIIEFF